MIAASALKASGDFTRLLLSATIVLFYAPAFYFVLLSSVGYLHHSQRLDPPAIFGIGLIVAGVLAINLLTRSVPY